MATEPRSTSVWPRRIWALRAMFRDVEVVYGFRIDGELEQVDGELDAVATLTLYRIVPEAVTNAVRRSGASKAVVTLRTSNGLLSATIRDEGSGFEWTEAGAIDDDGHIGLTRMHERVALVGGTRTVRSALGEGTTIRTSGSASEPDGHRGIER